MQAQRVGGKFKVENRPIAKGAFDAADMATFGLLPNEWRPTSQGQDVMGETGLDRFAGGVGSIAGLVGGAAGATKASKAGWDAIKKAFARKKADNIATNVYKGNLIGRGSGPPLQLGQGGRSLPAGPNIPQLPGGGRYPLQTTPQVGNVGRSLSEQQRRLEEAIAALRSNPYAQSFGLQKGGSVEGKKYSRSETSNKFQGTPADTKARMDRDPKFAAGMKEHYGVTKDSFNKGK